MGLTYLQLFKIHAKIKEVSSQEATRGLQLRVIVEKSLSVLKRS